MIASRFQSVRASPGSVGGRTTSLLTFSSINVQSLEYWLSAICIIGARRSVSQERLFGVGNNINEVVKVAFNGKIKPPASIHPGLPDATGLIIFFGV